jgi:hypothetical protein
MLHGAKIALPDDWEDFSVFRFRVPRPAEKPTPLSVKADPVRLEPNVIVTRHVRATTLAEVFMASNAEYHAANPTFEVLAAGTTRYRGQDAAWQDSRQTHPASSLVAYQKHIAIDVGENAYALVVITGDRPDVARLARSLELVT